MEGLVRQEGSGRCSVPGHSEKCWEGGGQISGDREGTKGRLLVTSVRTISVA